MNSLKKVTKFIEWQNHAERDFKQKKSLANSLNYLGAYITFILSTIVAQIRSVIILPMMLISKLVGKRKDKFMAFRETIGKEKKALVYFSASWCGPCMFMNPIINEFQKISSTRVIRIEVDDSLVLIKKLNLNGFPCFILFENGKEIRRKMGACTLNDLKNFQDVVI